MVLGVALLPFVDEKRLHRTLAKVYGDLTEDESKDFFFHLLLGMNAKHFEKEIPKGFNYRIFRKINFHK